MARVNDVLNAETKPQRALGRLLRSEYHGAVDPDDGEAIRGCWRSLKRGGLELGERGWSSPNTEADRLDQLRRSAERARKPLLEFQSPGDVDATLDAHEAAGARSNSAQRSYAAALRTFFRWLDIERGGFAWIEDFAPPRRQTDRKDPDEMLGEDDIEAIRRQLQFRRDKAFLELDVDTGLRRTAACQLRAGDVDLDNEPPTVRLNPDGRSQKGAEDHAVGRIDLKDSAVHVRTWLREDHPEAPDPPDDAPLFPVENGYDPEDRANCAAHPQTVADQVKDAAEDAGVSKPVNLHSFKHAAVKRFRWRYGMTWEAIRDRVLWSDNSLAEMMEIYGRLDEGERRERIREQMGQTTDQGDDGPAVRPCGTCSTEVPASANFCPQCGADPAEPPGADPDVREVVREEIARLFEDAESTHLAEFELTKAIADSPLSKERSGFEVDFN